MIALGALLALIAIGALYGSHQPHPGTLDPILKH